ncbi:unnamed protein product [Mytilus edulis]|uniref:CCHC-type domain-containing protein n=1 Tax=Mytilus edulis TaxID=6550 RepID=A0A8S3SCY7_MYTED|nr:unnamed protein product [Mytilus edulis]
MSKSVTFEEDKINPNISESSIEHMYKEHSNDLSQCRYLLSDSFISKQAIQEDEFKSLPTPTRSFDNITNIPKSTPRTDISHLPFTRSTTSLMSSSYSPASIPMEKIVKCREFSGYPQENAAKFMAEFESYSTLYDLLDSKRKIAAFHLHLKGPALTWFNNVSKTTKSDWTLLLALFKRHYMDFAGQSSTMLMTNEIFQNIRLSSGQAIEDFYCNLVEKAQILSKPEHEVLSKFINGLPDKMAFFVRAGNPTTLQAALTSSKMAEACGYRTEAISTQAIKNETKVFTDSKTEMDDLKDQIKTLTSMVANITVKTNDNQANTQRPNYRRQDYRQASNYPPRQQDSRECYGCRGQGHIHRDCNWTKTGPPNQSATFGKWLKPEGQARSFGQNLVSASIHKNNGTSFVHLQVSFEDITIAALVDTGSSINVISQTLYNTLPNKSKLSFEQFPSEVRLADNTKVKVFGLAKILVTCNNEQHAIEVYILPFTSHPLILGTNYLHSNNIILDFSNFSANFKSVKVQTHKKLTIPPNSECIVWGHVPTYVLPGLNGVCSNHKFILEKGLMVAKSLVTVSYNHKVPVKVLNATALSIVIPKDRTIAEFLSLNSDYSYVPIDQSCPVVQNIDIVNSCVTPDLNDCSESCSNEHIEKVKDQFTLSDHLSESQQTELASLLYKNIDLFVTNDNPNLGYTKLIEHTIHLKPNASGKHQKPYRLPPYKREILRHHLDKLLKQGIISPVSETEDLPITSPIVLVTKRSEIFRPACSSELSILL